MVDFLKANPTFSKGEYMYGTSIAQLTVMGSDFTHPKYLSDKQQERYKRLLASKGLDKDVVVVTSMSEFMNRNNKK